MEGRYRSIRAEDFSGKEFPAGTLKSRSSLRLPPQMREIVVSSLRSTSSHETTVYTLVLCGREGPQRTSAAEAFSEHHPVSTEMEKVSFLQLPGLFGKSQEQVKRDSSRCIAQCDPDGVNAFIYVLPLSPPTDEDKEEYKAIQNTFKSRVKFLSVVLFTVESDQTAADKDKLFNENKDVQELIQSCEGRCFFLRMKEKHPSPEVWEARTESMKRRSTFQSTDDLRMVLIGKTGSGKSSVANVLLGRKAFIPKALPKRANTTCEKETGEIDGRTVAVVNTPGLYNTTLSDEEIREELYKCFSMLSPGPHVFLLMLPIGFISPEEKDSVELIKRVFGEKSKDYIIIVFTRGGDLEGESIESYIEGGYGFVKKLVGECGGRYHVLTNKDYRDRQQARELLTKIESMVGRNGGSCYNAEMFQFAKEAVQREVKQLMKKEHHANVRHLEEMDEMKKKIETLQTEKQQDQRAKKQQEEEVEKLRQELRDMKARIDRNKCNIS